MELRKRTYPEWSDPAGPYMNYPGRTDKGRLYTHLEEIIERLKGMGYDFKTFHDVIATG